MNGDWIFHEGNYSCGFRVAGVIIRNGKILVQREKDGNEYAIPGGHVKMGETSSDSLRREFLEETGANIAIDRLLWTEECFWEWKGRHSHDICFYYLAHILPESEISEQFMPQADNPNVLVGWIDIDKLRDIIIYPEFIREEIYCIGNAPKHFITRA